MKKVTISPDGVREGGYRRSVAADADILHRVMRPTGRAT